MRRVRAILLALLGTLVVLLGVLQTETAFRHAIVPLASLFAPGRVEVDRGRLGLGGTLEVEGLRFDSEALGVRVAFEELFVDLVLSSLFWGPEPQIDLLRLRGAEIDLATAEADTREPQPEPEPQGVWKGRFALPVSIAQADLRDLHLRATEGEAPWAELNCERLTVAGLVPGGAASLSGSASVRIGSKEDPGYDGVLTLEAQVDRRADGDVESWTLASRADVSGPADPRPIRFTLDAKGSLPGGHDLTASGDLRAERGGQLLGHITTSASTAAGPEGGTVLEASLGLDSLTEAFLNPLLAPLRRGRVRRASLGGHFELTTDLPPETRSLPTRARGDLAIARLDYRTLALSNGRLRIAATPEKFEAELLPTTVNRGRVSARLSRELGGEEEHLQAALETQKLDLAALTTAFREDIPATLRGTLDLSATVSARAPPGSDLRRTANGTVRARLVQGRIEGFNLMAFLAEQSGVEAFKVIPLDDFDVISDTPIVDGVARLHETEVRSAAAQLVVNGTIALAGEADLTIEALVGPGVGSTLGRFGIELDTVKQYERMTSVPVAIGVSGPFGDLSYGPATPRTAQRAGDAVGDATGLVDRTTKGLTDLFKKRE